MTTPSAWNKALELTNELHAIGTLLETDTNEAEVRKHLVRSERLSIVTDLADQIQDRADQLRELLIYSI